MGSPRDEPASSENALHPPDFTRIARHGHCQRRQRQDARHRARKHHQHGHALPRDRLAALLGARRGPGPARLRDAREPHGEPARHPDAHGEAADRLSVAARLARHRNYPRAG